MRTAIAPCGDKTHGEPGGLVRCTVQSIRGSQTPCECRISRPPRALDAERYFAMARPLSESTRGRPSAKSPPPGISSVTSTPF